MHNKLIIHIRDEVVYIQVLDEIQVFLNFMVALMNLHDSLIPKKSSWRTVFLDVYMLDLKN